ncbi:MAG TPA: MHYT domain-containing protein [Opitutus sp.]|nr:MHYT domain-containing protein [Opitutus sp.]
MNDSTIYCTPDGVLHGSWNVALVVLSCVVAVGGSFAALDCAGRMRSATERKYQRRYFLAGGALMGVAIWTMHFVGMLALHLGMPVRYDPLLSVTSMAAAALGAGLAFLIVNGRTVTGFHVATGGIAMGLAIASMHYIGMASMRMGATIRYDTGLFAISVGIAIAASSGALVLARHPAMAGATHYWAKSMSAVVMGVAIAGMHYVGMAAARYRPSGTATAGEGATVGPWTLPTVLVSAGLVITVALLALAAKNAAERQLALESLEQKTAEAEAASQAKDVFLASLSHELRTPLNPALLIASDAAANPEFSAEARRAFATIERSIRVEARIIDDLLDLTRISRGLLQVESRTVDVHGVLQEAIAVVRPALNNRKIDLELEPAAVEKYTRGDSERLLQVFWNLLQNAVKFSSKGAKLLVSTRNVDSSVEVRVADQGMGMTEAELARCFETFTQGSHKRGGLGLGLSISRKIVELHGGTMTAASPGRGQGSTFTVKLRTTTAPPAAGSPPTAAAGGVEARKLAVLLVEDHESSRTTLGSLIARRGHAVTAAGTVQEALALARAQAFDLLVSDISLPDGDGYQLMRTLRAEQRMVGIAITGYGSKEDVLRANEAGFSSHITKPVSIASLETAIASAAGEIGKNSASA